jgi:hypothetical protein
MPSRRRLFGLATLVVVGVFALCRMEHYSDSKAVANEPVPPLPPPVLTMPPRADGSNTYHAATRPADMSVEQLIGRLEQLRKEEAAVKDALTKKLAEHRERLRKLGIPDAPPVGGWQQPSAPAVAPARPVPPNQS